MDLSGCERAEAHGESRTDALPGYAGLPRDMKDLEMAATVRFGARRFLRDSDGPQGTNLFLERAAQRAREGMPLDLLIAAHAKATHVLWEMLREEARAEESEELAELVDRLLRSQHAVLGSVVRTYQAESAAPAMARRERERALVRDLLHGGAPGRQACAELGLKADVSVLALSWEGEDRDGSADEGALVRDLRSEARLRRVLERLLSFAPCPVLVDGSTARALVAHGQEPAPDLAGRLSQEYAMPVRVAVVRAEEPEAVPEAAHTAGEVLRLARLSGCPPGVHRLADVLLEFQLTRPGQGGRAVAALLQPLRARPELIETLRVHLAQGRDRRATAAALTLHPNTVDNRLARVTRLTGIDLGTPHGAALAVGALLLHDTGRG
ncbi:PucR family transcriptional regulator [Streptomyces sp. NPDC016845]|uniref:PucR family transcriptional regulator n=1 Tax=Streptomyces sp. NPDC016845 TaxID=3364972 RepID=UPI003787EB48